MIACSDTDLDKSISELEKCASIIGVLRDAGVSTRSYNAVVAVLRSSKHERMRRARARGAYQVGGDQMVMFPGGTL